MRLSTQQEQRFLMALGLVTVFCLFLFSLRIFITGQLDFFFIPGNLALAWLALLFGGFLVEYLRSNRWASWRGFGLTALWLAFLPNSWYVLTDFIHVYPSGEISELFDVVLIANLVLCGFTLGFASLYLVHKELLKRLNQMQSWVAIEVIIFLSSFAVYLGRDLRWTTWDILTNPAGIILNVSDRVIDPFSQPRALNITLLFFVFISVLYLSVWLIFRPSSRRPSH